MDQLASSNISSEKEENSHKSYDNENETPEEDEFDLAYKMIFTDTLRMRDDQVGNLAYLFIEGVWMLDSGEAGVSGA